MLFLTGNTAKFIAVWLPMAGFYWALRDKTARKKALLLTIEICLSWIGIVLAAILLPAVALNEVAVASGCLFLYGSFFWLWRKKMSLWKANLIPLVISVIFISTGIVVAFWPDFINACFR